MQYVTFCAAPREGTAEWKIWEILPGQKQFDLFRMSVQRFDKEATFVILTDFKTQFDNITPDTKIARSEVNQREIMLERTRRQLAFLEQDDGNSPIVFADTDMLILAPLQQVFSGSFDVAVTIRKHDKMPINGGLFFVNNRSLGRGLLFFREVLYRMERELGTERREWYGDQLALAEILGSLKYERDIEKIRDFTDYSVLLLDSQKYNYSPPGDHPNLFQNDSGRFVYHFKGRCRNYMEHFFRLHISKKVTFGPNLIFLKLLYQLQLDLARFRQKRLFASDIRRKFNRKA